MRKKRNSMIRKAAYDLYAHKLNCVNCGTSENIELHHIVPICFGGNDIVSNIVPLCHKCHLATHHAKDISHYSNKKGSGGRPPIINNDVAFSAMDKWANGEIGERRCKELMGLSNGTHVKQTSQYKKWKEERDIINVKNYFDVTATKSPSKLIYAGGIVGYIDYKNGDRKNIYYHKSHENDGVIYTYPHNHYLLEGETKNKLTWGEVKHIEASFLSLSTKTEQQTSIRIENENDLSKISGEIYQLPLDKFGRIIVQNRKDLPADFLKTEGVILPIQEALKQVNDELMPAS